MIEDTRARLIASARRAFATQGYANTSMDDFTARAGLTRGALYHHFGDKKGLRRYGHAYVPLDESLSRVVIDLSGRPELVFDVYLSTLPAYDRVISTLRGDMVLAHNGGEQLTLHPYEIHDFSGADDTHSWGRCTDFNLMLRRGQCRGCVTAHFPHGTETLALHAGETALLFCGEGSVTLRAGTETLTLAAHESALIEDAPAQLTVEGSAKLMLAQMYR